MDSHRNRGLHLSNQRIRVHNLGLEDDPYCFWGAKRYDHETSCMSDRYREAHAVQNSVVCRALDENCKENPIVLDLGCGTGTDGLYILSKYNQATYVGVDSSAYMLKIASQKFAEKRLQSKCYFLNFDFQLMTSEYLLAEMESVNLGSEVLCVISSLALHHYEIEARRNVYVFANNVLAKGGFLVLTDLYSNSIKMCIQIALDQEVHEVREAIARLEKNNVTNEGGTTLSVHHYTNVNRPSALLRETHLLMGCGFDGVDVVYRNGQLGVLLAEKENV